jgi:alpha-tubulin suppressor-like RCC1 family protein
VLDDDSVKCWGYNVYGQLGLDDVSTRGSCAEQMGDKLDAVDLGPGRAAKMISAGRYHTCAVLDDDSVKCWGANDQGQLGLRGTSNRGDGPGEMGDKLDAVDLGTGRTAKTISAGDHHTCAVLDDDSVKCWGMNGRGQLGLGDTAKRGASADEMGDNLPVVDFGTYVDEYGRSLRVIS